MILVLPNVIPFLFQTFPNGIFILPAKILREIENCKQQIICGFVNR